MVVSALGLILCVLSVPIAVALAAWFDGRDNGDFIAPEEEAPEVDEPNYEKLCEWLGQRYSSGD